MWPMGLLFVFLLLQAFCKRQSSMLIVRPINSLNFKMLEREREKGRERCFLIPALVYLLVVFVCLGFTRMFYSFWGAFTCLVTCLNSKGAKALRNKYIYHYYTSIKMVPIWRSGNKLAIITVPKWTISQWIVFDYSQ